MPNELKHYGVKGMKWDPSKKTGKTYEELLKEKQMTAPNNVKMTSRTMTDDEYAEYKKRRENKSTSQSKPADTKPNDRHNLSAGATGKAGIDAFLNREKERKAKAESDRKKKEFKKSKTMKTLKRSLGSSAYKVSTITRNAGKSYAELLLSKSYDVKSTYDLLKQKTTTK